MTNQIKNILSIISNVVNAFEMVKRYVGFVVPVRSFVTKVNQTKTIRSILIRQVFRSSAGAVDLWKQSERVNSFFQHFFERCFRFSRQFLDRNAIVERNFV